MGTRADFYVGSGPSAEWLGSVAWDGYEWAEETGNDIAKATTEEEFRAAVAKMFAGRDDVSTPATGWPWPWNDSGTTDYVYYFEDGQTRWNDRRDWPNMEAIKQVAWDGRSGLLIHES